MSAATRIIPVNDSDNNQQQQHSSIYPQVTAHHYCHEGEKMSLNAGQHLDSSSCCFHCLPDMDQQLYPQLTTATTTATSMKADHDVSRKREPGAATSVGDIKKLQSEEEEQAEKKMKKRCNNQQQQQQLEDMKKRFPELFQEEILDDDDDDVCPICIELFTSENPAIPCECSHQFHFQCVEEWLQRSSECPVCYKKLKYEMMSSDQDVAFARQQLGYHTPAEQHQIAYQQNSVRPVQYDSLMSSHHRSNNQSRSSSTPRMPSSGIGRTSLVNNSSSSVNTPAQQRSSHNTHRPTAHSPTARPNRQRGFFGKLFDKLFAPTSPSAATSISSSTAHRNRRNTTGTSNPRRSQIVF